jgi:hypothetical protein
MPTHNTLIPKHPPRGGLRPTGSITAPERCPRCAGRMSSNDDGDLNCLVCGAVVYRKGGQYVTPQMPRLADATMHCIRCGETKPASEFGPRASTSLSGKGVVCRACWKPRGSVRKQKR